MDLFFIGLIGLCIGSFVNVCIYRIIREESIVFPASHCITCGYEINWYDLIPVFSYAILGGKCRVCSNKISLKYPVIEVLNAILYLIIFLNYGYSLEFLKCCVLASLLIVIGFIDYETKYVYNSTIMFGIAIGIVFLIIQSSLKHELLWDNINGALIGFSIIYLIVIITKSMGEGDIWIATLCGLFLGVKGVLVTIIISIVIGGITGIFIITFKLKSKKSKIAFGPYLAMGAIVSSIMCNEIINWYIEFLMQ